ncbi:hypothetical protein KS4_08750 [Poriferisphaera corsica]|uniref:Cardiolipin synthase N-terminal domain-containing protein n=1 Tax=Poriferisphaera corsica TaxID=2528020 RepID=A0A517YRI5_9BACT|nr:PLD nuclease N-terminal domain-containing protein [Poriferisphaera corsica]QDU32839.1 hypothetical protein KS4_08750 [Poriferisphaera corsica]
MLEMMSMLANGGHDALSFLPVFGCAAFGGLIGLLFLIFWIWMLVDCCTKQFKNNDKVIWILVIIFAGGIGALIYFLVGRNTAIEER